MSWHLSPKSTFLRGGSGPWAHTSPHPKWHLDQFSHFCRARTCDRQTRTQMDCCACVTIGCVLCCALRCSLMMLMTLMMLVCWLYGRLVEEIRSECGGLKVEPDSVYMASVFSEFIQTLVLVSRGISLKPPFTYHAVSMPGHQGGHVVICVCLSFITNHFSSYAFR